jgi:hypothetical protein
LWAGLKLLTWAAPDKGMQLTAYNVRRWAAVDDGEPRINNVGSGAMNVGFCALLVNAR